MKIATFLIALFCLAASAACGSEAEPLNESRAKLTENGHFFVSYEPQPTPIPFNELFTLQVKVAEGDNRDTMISDADIEVRAEMPVHEHGMTTAPAVTPNGDGTFLVEGMKFHMRSTSDAEYWTIEVDVNSGDTSDTAVFTVMCCEE